MSTGEKHQWTALHLASCNGHVEVVKVLLAHPDISVNCKNDYGATPLSLGCWGGHVPVVELLLKDPRVDVAVGDDNGRTPLWEVSSVGKYEVVEWLLASGRDLGDMNAKENGMAKNTPPWKLQERTRRVKLCLCLKDS